MHIIANFIDKLNRLVGQVVSWLALLLVFLVIGDVLFRYLFSVSMAWTAELAWHLFSLLFLLAAGYTFQADRHVRVDVFYQRFSLRHQQLVNLLGCLFFLLPFCAIGFWESLSFVKSAYDFGETSADPGGLSHRFLIKAAIPIGFLWLGLQGVSTIIKNFYELTK